MKTKINLPQHIKQIPFISKIKKIIKEEKVEAYLVGGFLRDIYLGKAFNKYDFDFTLTKKTEKVARIFAKETGGTCIMLDKVNRSIRVSVKHKGKILDYDFNKLRADTIEEDLCMRDFTVNSMAVNLLDKTTSVIDPCGGISSIKIKALKTEREANLRDDPVRIMRAYSMSALHGFEIEPTTRKYLKKYSQKIVKAPFERISEELFKIFSNKSSFKFIIEMDNDDVLDKIFPEIKKMRGMKQGDYHHLDVLLHSFEALNCYERLYSHDLKGHSDLIDYLDLEVAQGRTRYQLVKLACLLHDIGKPAAKASKEGRTIFYEHDKIGSDMVGKISKRLKLSGKEDDFLKLLVKMHMRPGHLADIKTPTDRAIFRFFKASQGEGAGIIVLCLSDWHATCGPAIDLKLRKSHERIMLKLIDDYFAKQKEKPVKKLLSGDDIMKILKVKPSPLVGKVLAALEEAQAMGEINTKAQAREFIKGWKNEN